MRVIRGTNAATVKKNASSNYCPNQPQMTSQQLPEAHAALAASFGIPHVQITIVSNNAELREAARLFGDAKAHEETVIGLCIRAESGDEFADPQIVLVWRVSESVHRHTYDGLKALGKSHILNYLDTNKSEWLLAFLMLHEIAHYQLNHGPNGDEEDADLWAHPDLVKRYGTFA